MEVQSRFVGWLEETRQRQPDARIAVVSHADPIKTVIAHYAGIHLDMFERFEIAPASVTTLRVEDFGPRVVTMNSLDHLAL